MLQRQQAGAIIAAHQRIVEDAVGMMEMALDMLRRAAQQAGRLKEDKPPKEPPRRSPAK